MAEGNTNPQVIVQVTSRAPGMPLRILWFLFFGSWLSFFAIFWAWVFNTLIITLPLGLYILNRLPQIATLRASNTRWGSSVENGVTVMRETAIPQRGFLVRTVYYLLIGWWFSFIWLIAAWLFQWTIILLPLTFLMFAKAAAVTTLRRT